MEANKLEVHLRSRVAKASQAAEPQVRQRVEQWLPERTAIIVCDMWDDHWCTASARRVVEMAPVMNNVLRLARQRGVTIIHAPSETMAFYDGTPQRKRAQAAPRADLPILANPPAEPPLPIDDSDGGCDSGEPPHKAWTRQIAAIEIAAEDAVSDIGTEVTNLLAQHRIDDVVLMGVHTNMCILNRPFAIRRLVTLKKRIVLMRDMTDTMYNPARRPFVDHFEGTSLVVRHIETYLCPTITSTDFTGRPPFRFAEDRRPQTDH